MGVGNLQGALRAYGGGSGVSYTRLYFDSTPLRHAAAYSRLAALGDEAALALVGRDEVGFGLQVGRVVERIWRPDELDEGLPPALGQHNDEILNKLARSRR